MTGDRGVRMTGDRGVRMLVTYGEYKKLGYSGAERRHFCRLEVMAAQAVNKFTFGRVCRENMTAANRRGVCELVEHFRDAKLKGRLTGFNNEGYSESYAAPEKENVRVSEIMAMYFTAEQLYRGA